MSHGYDYDLLCIGSGPAGQRGAVAAAKMGKRVAVIENRRIVGGVAVTTGTIPSKTFREAVLHLKKSAIQNRERFQRKSRPQIQDLLGRVSEVVQRESDVMERQLERNDIDLLWGNASFRNPHVVAIDDPEKGERIVTADKILLAVGTRPAAPPGIEPDGQRVITSDMLLQLSRLPRKMIVVGAGVIGIEYAAMFAELGVDVTVVDGRERPLEFLDREMVDELIHQMRNVRVSFRLGERVASVNAADKSKVLVQLESGKRLVGDLMLFSVGRVGATDKLNLAAAGLGCDERGRIAVNDRFQTEVPHIYAAGDVIGYPALASTSSAQGRRAACYAFGDEPGDINQLFPFGIYAIPEISMVGQTEQELTKERVPYEVGIARYREIARGQILGDDSGLFKMLFHRQSRKLLGVHIIGTGATELLHIGQAVMSLGGGLDYFLGSVFNYPTLAECYKVAAFDAQNKLAYCAESEAPQIPEAKAEGV